MSREGLNPARMRGASSCLRHAQVGHALSTLSPLRLPTAVSKDMQHERSKQIFGAHPPAPAPTTRTAVSTKERKTSNDNDVLQTKESSCAADHRKLGESELHRRREPSKIVLRRVQAQSKHKEVGKCERKTFDVKCDGYMWGLAGAERLNSKMVG